VCAMLVRWGRGSGCQVRVKARIAARPAFDAGVLVGGIMVHDQVQLEFFGCLLIDAFQEVDEFLMSV